MKSLSDGIGIIYDKMPIHRVLRNHACGYSAHHVRIGVSRTWRNNIGGVTVARHVM